VTESQQGARPTPVQIRAEFEQLIVDDLYGPAGGDEEQLADLRPSERYLVGMLAPKGTLAADPERQDDARVEQTDGEEALPDAPAAPAALFPASKGLSFAVPREADGLVVTATWGHYSRLEVEAAAPADTVPPTLDEAAGAPAAAVGKGTVRVWQRRPAGGSVPLSLPVDGGEVGPLVPDPEFPEVVITGRASLRDEHLLVSLFLVNEQPQQKMNKDERWLFQAEFSVAAADGAPVLVGRDRVLGERTVTASHREQDEMAQLDMLYRDHVEFAVGHGTAVTATPSPDDPRRAVRVGTESIPRYEVPRTDPPAVDEFDVPGLADVVLDMAVLAQAAPADLAGMVAPLVGAYEAWLDQQEQRLDEPGLQQHLGSAAKSLADARVIAGRLRAGVDVLASDPEAQEAFGFANWSMWQQRVRALAADRRRRTGDPLEECLALMDVPGNRSWRPFQLAFLLLNLPSLTDPLSSERTSARLVDLLFFPTGGGKTEAYLGLTAYTFAIRRLQGDRFGLDGRDGVAVLMRYTLRLLTAQQFQRAAALVAACEVRRRELAKGDERWTGTPFRIGLWVGGSLTPNTFDSADQMVGGARMGGKGGGVGRATPLQLVSCPWCGSSLGLTSDVQADTVLWRTLVYCSDKFGDCPFTEAGEERDGLRREGIPVVTVDDEIYRLLPSLIISTADKFAQLPWQGQLHLLFGKVSRRCTRHGYRSPDLDKSGSHEEKDSHNASGSFPRAETVDVEPLRPPDLIIQDELHLISGPLGSMTGLYETAIDLLATWKVDGVDVAPKVIASTATVRRAADQAHALFGRRLAVFPPPVLDVGSNFFSVQRPTAFDPADPDARWAAGRLYMGVCGFGSRLKSVQARVFMTLLAAGKRLFDRYGDDADPYLTMVGYYSALRELAGGRRLVDDDVRSRLYAAERRGLGKRTLRVVEELTSRKASTDIPAILDQLGQPFTKAGEDAYAAKKRPANAAPDAGLATDYRPIDVLLATNMISVGVDVPRLGLMVTVGQPKATSEYIQATSRVGRDARGPGIVVTLYNWARPRDLSHYETFEHYHATFYKHVEALSVTPFAPRAVDRGLTAVLVSMVRHDEANTAVGQPWNPEPGAQVVTPGATDIAGMVSAIGERAELVTGEHAVRSQVEAALQMRLDSWARRQGGAAREGAPLGYRGRGVGMQALLRQPVPGGWDEWSCPNSLRETEANINLLVDLWDASLAGAPDFAYLARPADDDDEVDPLTVEDLDPAEGEGD
jgi:hypothetical protein